MSSSLQQQPGAAQQQQQKQQQGQGKKEGGKDEGLAQPGMERELSGYLKEGKGEPPEVGSGTFLEHHEYHIMKHDEPAVTRGVSGEYAAQARQSQQQDPKQGSAAQARQP